MSSRPPTVTFHLLYLWLLLAWDQRSEVRATSCSQLCHYVPWARDADCSRRHLESVPLECRGSKVLNLNKNNITVVPMGSFSSFGHLKYLQMLENNIQIIFPNSFAGARRLTSVNLNQNSLNEVPVHTFNDTSSLRWVYLSRNKITQIAECAFQDSPRIEILHLDNNFLAHIHSGLFRGLPRMQRLLLGDNELQELPQGVFQELGDLYYLDLSRNRLQTLSANAFSGLAKLETLKLSGNMLVTITPGTFSGVPVTTLDISGNRLGRLPWEESDFDGLEEIDAAGNPWICDCSLEPFRAVLARLSMGVDSTVICAAPRSLRHTDIVSHTTLCPTSTISLPPKRLGKNDYWKQVDPDPTDDEVIQGDTPMSAEMITLITATGVTVAAIVLLSFFLLVTCIILPRRRRKDDVTITNYEVKITETGKAAKV